MSFIPGRNPVTLTLYMKLASQAPLHALLGAVSGQLLPRFRGALSIMVNQVHFVSSPVFFFGESSASESRSARIRFNQALSELNL